MASSPQQIKAVSCLLSRLTMSVSPLVYRVPILEWWLSDSVVIVGTHCVFFVGRSVGRSVACCLVIAPFTILGAAVCRQCLSSHFSPLVCSVGCVIHQSPVAVDLGLSLRCTNTSSLPISMVCLAWGLLSDFVLLCVYLHVQRVSHLLRPPSLVNVHALSINLLTSLSCVVLAVPLQYTDPSCEADIH